MRKILLLFFLLNPFISLSQIPKETEEDLMQTEILILGTLHFNQFHNINNDATNFSSRRRKKEFIDVIDKLNSFKPDAVFVEREPNKQTELDSLFTLKKFEASKLSDGMSEVYQIGFKLAKANKLQTVYGVDYYESISQDLFETGKNIEKFKNALNAFQNKGRGITKQFLNGNMSINDFLIELNRKENVQMSHRLLFNTPAYVTEGTFKNEDKYSNVDNDYIGAEYISLFYERNLKIYSNILNNTEKIKAIRVILIIGQVHVGVLQEIIGNNPFFKVIDANEYLE